MRPDEEDEVRTVRSNIRLAALVAAHSHFIKPQFNMNLFGSGRSRSEPSENCCVCQQPIPPGRPGRACKKCRLEKKQ